MRKDQVSILLVVLLLPVFATAQSSRTIERKADDAFEKKDYFAASKMYAAILYDSPLVAATPKTVYPFLPRGGKHVSQVSAARRNEVIYKLAESYRLNNRSKEASQQYEKLVSSQDSRFPQLMLWYGSSLLADNEPEKATTAFNTYLKQHRAKDEFAEKAKQGLASAQFVIASRSSKPSSAVSKLQATSSGDGSNFGLDKLNDSVVLFTSSRPELNAKGEQTFPVNLYTAPENGKSAKKLLGFAGDLNMATPSIASDGLTMYFTGWKNNLKTGPTPYHIYYTTRASADSPWRRPVEMPAPVNVNGYQSKQPFITNDGAYLFFASDQPGGKGKMDIWMVPMNGREPMARAFNLDSVNTAADEVTPFYDAANSKLYFSSDGRVGMGGLDIYEASGTPGHNIWSAITNMGAPVNSVRDDEYYRKDIRSGNAYLSSDRASSCCLEIFRAVAVKTIDSAKQVMASAPTLNGLKPVTTGKDTIRKQSIDSLNAITASRNYIHYDYASSRIRNIDKPTLDRIVQEMKKDAMLNIVVASFTDCLGTLEGNIRIARKRSESVKAYLVEHGIAASRINTDFFGKQHFVVACTEGKTPDRAEQIANRRSDLILTREKNAQWKPAGNELDIDKSQYSPLHRVVKSESKPATNTTVKGTGKPAGNRSGATVNHQPATTGGGNLALRNAGATVPGRNLPAKESSKTNQPNSNNNVVAPNRGTISADNNTNKSTARNTANGTSAARPAPAPNKGAVASTPTKNNVAAADKTNKLASGYRKSASDKASKSATAATTPKVKTETVRQKVTDDAGGAERFATTKRMEKLQINKMLEFVPRALPGVIAEMTKRVPRKPLVLYSTSDSVRIDLYDNGVFDNDSVSVIYNKELVSYKQLLLTNKPITFYVKLHADPMQNEMILFAENLGLTPPNSALMIITDGDKKRTEVNVTSDLEHNTVIYFIKVNKEKQ